MIIVWLALTILPIVLGLVIGSWLQRRHLRSLASRAADYQGIVLADTQNVVLPNPVAAGLVIGSAVIAVDYFRQVAASFKNMFGGEISGIRPAMFRAREEARLRMMEQAAGLDARAVVNVRYETSTIKGSATEVFCVGTAIR